MRSVPRRAESTRWAARTPARVTAASGEVGVGHHEAVHLAILDAAYFGGGEDPAGALGDRHVECFVQQEVVELRVELFTLCRIWLRGHRVDHLRVAVVRVASVVPAVLRRRARRE